MEAPIPTRRLRWAKSHRLINSRYPPIDLFERVCDPADLETMFQLDMLTNPRIRDQVGQISMVPPEERVSGPGASWVMSAFTHIGFPSRFSDGSYGVYYAGRSLETAVREVAYHMGRFYGDTDEPSGQQMTLRQLIAKVDARYHDIRSGHAAEHNPNSYVASQILGKELRDAGSRGIVYRSVRHREGECIAAFVPKAVAIPSQGAHVALHWDGKRIDRWLRIGIDDDWLPLPS